MSDLFVSYSRKNRVFVETLVDTLKDVGVDVWVDWEDIPFSVDWWQRICAGIDGAKNVAIVISEEWLVSEVCNEEMLYARGYNKRLIPILLSQIDERKRGQELADKLWERQNKTLADEQWHLLQRSNWVDFTQFDFSEGVKAIVTTISENVEHKDRHTEILLRARKWESEGRGKSFLLVGQEIRDAEIWLSLGNKKAPIPTPLHTEYILNSRKAESRKRRSLAAGVVVTLTVLVTLGILAFNWLQVAQVERKNRANMQERAENEADVAYSRQLADRAESYLNDGQLDLALLSSVEANIAADTIESRKSLFAALEYNPQIMTFLRGHSNSIDSLAFSPDGRILASGSRWDSSIILWDRETGKPIGEWLRHQQVRNLAFSPDGRILASSGWRTIILWDLSNDPPTEVHLTEHEGYVDFTSIAFSPNGQMLVSVSCEQVDSTFSEDCDESEITLWDLTQNPPTGSSLLRFSGEVNTVAFSRNGEILVIVNNNASIVMWDLSTGQWYDRGRPLQFSDQRGENVRIAFGNDGRMAISGSSNTLIDLWDVMTGTQQGQLINNGYILSLAFSPKGELLASGGDSIMLWNVITREEIGSTLIGHEWVESLAFSPDSRILASGSCGRSNSRECMQGEIILWDLTAKQRLGRTLVPNYTEPLQIITFSSDGDNLLSWDGNDSLIQWDIEAEQTIGIPLTELENVVFSIGGQIIATGFRWDNILLLRASISDYLCGDFAEFEGCISQIAFSSNGQRLAIGSSEGAIVVWNVVTGELVNHWLIHDARPVHALAISPDGQVVASTTTSYGSCDLWDASTGARIGGVNGHTNVIGYLSFSLDGHYLVSYSTDGVIVSDVLGTLPNAEFPKASIPLALSPDGQILVSGKNNEIVIWDVATQQIIGVLPAATAPLAFSPDGQTLVSGSSENAFISWDMNLDSWQSLACRIANRQEYWEICPNLSAP